MVDLVAHTHRRTPSNTRITIAGHMTETEVLISVSDNAPGIPAAELLSVFQRFHRFTSAEGGSGLGLAIARAIVERSSGRIWAESQFGHGTTF